MRERGLKVDHATVFRRVQRYAPENDRRLRPHLEVGGTSYLIDETYFKVGTQWKSPVRGRRSRGLHNRVHAQRQA